MCQGKPLSPIEELADSSLRGGRQALQPEMEEQEGDTGGRRKNRVRQEARKKKLKADREELQSFRKGSKGGGAKGSGEACYAWNNGNGLCGGLPPGEPCKSKSSAPTSMHSMWIPRASFEELPGVKEDLSWHPLAAWLFAYGGSGGSQSSGKRKEDHTEEQGRSISGRNLMKELRRTTKRRKFTGDDPPGDEEPPKDKIHVRGHFMSFEEYLKVRKFTFFHHYSGEVDNVPRGVPLQHLHKTEVEEGTQHASSTQIKEIPIWPPWVEPPPQRRMQHWDYLDG